MQLIHNLEELPYTSALTLTLGFFDGFHKGHRKILQRVLSIAKNKNAKTAVFSFLSHPRWLLSPGAGPKLISPISFKVDFLKELDIDYLIAPDFSSSFAQTYAWNYLQKLKEKTAHLDMIVGSNCRFGHKNKGNIQTLKSFEERHDGFCAEIVGPVLCEGQQISSTMIRNLIHEGKIRKANSLLERPFFVMNTIVKGNQRGREIGFPTINVPILATQIAPKRGVYTGRVLLEGKIFRAIIYVGDYKLEEKLESPLVEAHLIGYSGNAYGKMTKIDFLDWIREPKSFKNIKELKQQLLNDKKML